MSAAGIRYALAEYATARDHAKALRFALVKMAVQLGQDQGHAVQGDSLAYLEGYAQAAERKAAEAVPVASALSNLISHLDPPDALCSCHVAAPCGDCVEHSAARDAIDSARKLIAKIEAAA